MINFYRYRTDRDLIKLIKIRAAYLFGKEEDDKLFEFILVVFFIVPKKTTKISEQKKHETRIVYSH